ncbi:transglutaminaseTgpA domain-containing protein [Kitasatospora sp. NPDC048365]|uniref:transglutaminase family protein n=1 Tax=Kitasatospora sp. NPDC048365 TaxID=3364050 RepID=UPI00371BD154
MTTRAKLTFCAALATALAALSLMPLFNESIRLIPHGLLMIVATAGIGATLRVLPLPRMLVVPLQLLAVLYLLLLTFVQPSMAYGVLPGPKALDAVGALLNSGGNDIGQYAIPAPATDGLRLIVIGAVSLVAVAVDGLAVTFRRAAAAGLPLLALYSVGTGLAGSAGAAWLWFTTASIGYLVLLFTEGQDRLSRWGRVFTGAGRTSGGLSHSGQRVGVIALLAAMLLPAFLPNAGTGLIGGFGNGTGTGTGPGVGGERSLNLVVALTANLRSSDDTELLRYTTDPGAAEQMYLRVAALSDFNGEEWKIGDQNLENVPPGPLPSPEGLSSSIATGSVRTTVKISDKLSTTWLPMPYPAAWVEVGPTTNWRFDRGARTLSTVGSQKLNNLQYAVGSTSVQPTAAQLRAAGTAPTAITNRYLSLPPNLPPVVAATAAEVTRGKRTAYDQAVALQQYFTSGAFTYSTKVEPRTGPEAIAKFLQEKDGFCVHYAATMAAMARSLKIPARVAIGFTAGTGNDTNRIVRSSNFHAWPELYFQGIGWLRFEPTPNRGVVPDYTREQVAPAPSATAQQPTAAPTDSAAPAPSASSKCSAEQRKAGACEDESQVAEQKKTAPAWWQNWTVLVAVLGGLVVLALLATPMLWRARQRRRRLGAGRHGPGGGRSELSDAQVLAAWAELIDSAWDLGIPPDDARTPRHTVRRLTEQAELGPEAAAAAGRVALATERVMYARSTEAPTQLATDVRTARDGLRARVGRAGRIRAVLLPASAVRLRWTITDRVAAVRDRVTGTLGRVSAAVTGTVARPLRRLRRRKKDA